MLNIVLDIFFCIEKQLSHLLNAANLSVPMSVPTTDTHSHESHFKMTMHLTSKHNNFVRLGNTYAVHASVPDACTDTETAVHFLVKSTRFRSQSIEIQLISILF